MPCAEQVVRAAACAPFAATLGLGRQPVGEATTAGPAVGGHASRLRKLSQPSTCEE